MKETYRASNQLHKMFDWMGTYRHAYNADC